jgi:hypothetical protein
VLVLLAVASVVAAPAAGRAGILTQARCPGRARVTVFRTLGHDLLENLLFADGSLWVSDSSASKVRRFAPSGRELAGVAVPAPGGLVQEPDGLIYAAYGDSFEGAVEKSGKAGVMRFSPIAPVRSLQTYASGLNMANGLALGPNGDLYTSNDVDYGLVVIPRADPASWHELAHVWGTNGVVVDPSGTNLYANITFDQRSPIVRVPLADPSATAVAVQLTVGVVSLQPAVYTDPDTSRPLVGLKGLDDLTAGPDGILYPVANGMGELLRVDPSSGAACLIASGFRNPTSVRIAPEDSAFADHNPATIDFYVTQWSGAIAVVRYRP